MTWNGPTTNLVHRWPMDDANVSGVTITDVVGSLNGTAGTSVASASGPYGTSRLIGNDANAGISLASTPIANMTSAFSVGVWLLKTDVSVGPYDSASQKCRVFSFYDGTNSVEAGLHFAGDGQGYPNGSVSVGFAVGHTSMVGNTTNTILVNNNWAHLTVTWDGATTIFYVNGMAVAADTVNFTATTTVNSLGCWTSVGSRPWNGKMYQFVLYTKALSATEVTQLFSAEASSGIMTPDYIVRPPRIIAY